MSLKMSDSVLSAMGFPRLDAPTTINASFHLLEVFSILGIEVENGAVETLNFAYKNTDVRLGIGDSVNDICKALFVHENVFVEDERAWQDEHSAEPPYVIVRFGPVVGCEQVTHAEIGSDNINIYNCFSSARKALIEQSERYLSSVIANLIVGSNDLAERSKVIHRDRLLTGLTDDLKIVRVTYLSSQGNLSVLEKLSASQLKMQVLQKHNSPHETSQEASKFFELAYREQHSVLKFLNFFLVLERAIKKTYRAIPNTAKNKVKYGRSKSERKYLINMFMCCVEQSWGNDPLFDSNAFKNFKEIRDDIAHGHRSDVAAHEVESIELFTAKVLRYF